MRSPTARGVLRAVACVAALALVAGAVACGGELRAAGGLLHLRQRCLARGVRPRVAGDAAAVLDAIHAACGGVGCGTDCPGDVVLAWYLATCPADILPPPAAARGLATADLATSNDSRLVALGLLHTNIAAVFSECSADAFIAYVSNRTHPTADAAQQPLCAALASPVEDDPGCGAAVDYTTLRAVFEGSVSGAVTLWQAADDAAARTMLHVDLTADVPSVGHAWHVHEAPLDAAGTCASAGAHFNPAGVAGGAGVGGVYACNRSHVAGCEVGDLSGKHGALNLSRGGAGGSHMVDTNLPLSGVHSIAGRSIVLHAREAGPARYACANITDVSDRWRTSAGNDAPGRAAALLSLSARGAAGCSAQLLPPMPAVYFPIDDNAAPADALRSVGLPPSSQSSPDGRSRDDLARYLWAARAADRFHSGGDPIPLALANFVSILHNHRRLLPTATTATDDPLPSSTPRTIGWALSPTTARDWEVGIFLVGLVAGNGSTEPPPPAGSPSPVFEFLAAYGHVGRLRAKYQTSNFTVAVPHGNGTATLKLPLLRRLPDDAYFAVVDDTIERVVSVRVVRRSRPLVVLCVIALPLGLFLLLLMVYVLRLKLAARFGDAEAHETFRFVAVLWNEMTGIMFSNILSVVLGLWLLMAWAYSERDDDCSPPLTTIAQLLGSIWVCSAFWYPLVYLYIFFRGEDFYTRLRTMPTMTSVVFDCGHNFVTAAGLIAFISFMVIVCIHDRSACSGLHTQCTAVLVAFWALQIVMRTYYCFRKQPSGDEDANSP